MARCTLCIKFDECPWRTEPDSLCSAYQQKPQTNADRIRSMTDEELAEFIGDNIDCCICKKEYFHTAVCPGSVTNEMNNCYATWLGWLKQEVTE